MKRYKTLIVAAFTTAAVVVAMFTVYRVSQPNRRTPMRRVVQDSPLGDLPASHKFDGDKLREAVLAAAAELPDAQQLASHAVDLADTYGQMTPDKYEAYLDRHDIDPMDYWNDPSYADTKATRMQTTAGMVCGWKDLQVRPLYLDGRKQSVTIAHGVQSVFDTRRHSLPDINELDVYEVLVPAYGLQTLGGRYFVKELNSDGQGTPVEHERRSFDGTIGFWMTYHDGQWLHIGLSIYPTDGATTVAAPIL